MLEQYLPKKEGHEAPQDLKSLINEYENKCKQILWDDLAGQIKRQDRLKSISQRILMIVLTAGLAAGVKNCVVQEDSKDIVRVIKAEDLRSPRE